jgi:hypothetical protein
MAAAGNYWPLVVAPARLPNCLAIAATNVANRPWKHSSRGREVDFSAPGEDVWCAVARREDGVVEYSTGAHSGTSFAVAHTAGAAALWLKHHGRDELIAAYGRGGLHDAFRAAAVASVQPGAAPWDGRRFGPGVLDVAALLRRGLPGDRAVARAVARTTPAGDLAPSERLAQLLPELTPAQAKTRLAGLLGTPRRDVESDLEPVAAELHYLLLEHRELRGALVAETRGAGVRALTAHVSPVRAGLYALGSSGLRARLGAG